jgi:predicted ABC-type ATPase
MPYPNVYIIAGCNGVGKTTFGSSFLFQMVQCSQFINADAIARGLNPLNPESVAMSAGRMLTEQIRSACDQKFDFCFETTLAGKNWVREITKMKHSGYCVHIHFLWIPEPQTAVARIKERVRHGGHHIPEDVVLRRYSRGIQNFLDLYGPISDTWTFYDNSDSVASLIASTDQHRLSILNPALFEQFKHAADGQEEIS